jgi:Family of unknown function (DUF6232)
MTTYYRDRSVEVTSERVTVDGHTYRLVDLGRVWHRRGGRSWRALAGRGALGAAMLVPLVTAAIGLVVAVRIDASPGTTVTLIAAAILVGLAAVPVADLLLDRVDRSYDEGSRCLEMWAEVRGTAVLLLRTRNRRQFGQIYRAVQRALEQADRRRSPVRATPRAR